MDCLLLNEQLQKTLGYSPSVEVRFSELNFSTRAYILLAWFAFHLFRVSSYVKHLWIHLASQHEPAESLQRVGLSLDSKAHAAVLCYQQFNTTAGASG